MESPPVLVTGATGYVGGRLVPHLLRAGHRVRVMGRSLEKLRCRPWAGDPGVELVKADVFDYGSLEAACKGCRALMAYADEGQLPFFLLDSYRFSQTEI